MQESVAPLAHRVPTAAERRPQVWEMRVSGHNVSQIARHFRVHRRTIDSDLKAIQKDLAKRTATADDKRRLNASRLEMLFRTALGLMERGSSDQVAASKAVDAALEAMEAEDSEEARAQLDKAAAVLAGVESPELALKAMKEARLLVEQQSKLLGLVSSGGETNVQVDLRVATAQVATWTDEELTAATGG